MNLKEAFRYQNKLDTFFQSITTYLNYSNNIMVTKQEHLRSKSNPEALDETIDTTKEHTIFDPNATWKQKTLTNFTARELQVPIFKNGECVYESPSIEEIKAYCQKEVETLWDEVKRFENPHRYYVDLSQKLWDIKKELCVKNAMKSK